MQESNVPWSNQKTICQEENEIYADTMLNPQEKTAVPLEESITKSVGMDFCSSEQEKVNAKGPELSVETVLSPDVVSEAQELRNVCQNKTMPIKIETEKQTHLTGENNQEKPSQDALTGSEERQTENASDKGKQAEPNSMLPRITLSEKDKQVESKADTSYKMESTSAAVQNIYSDKEGRAERDVRERITPKENQTSKMVSESVSTAQVPVANPGIPALCV